VSGPELIGHRGAPRERTENTLPAFERALALGAQGVELDVHLTRDGVAVVHHDPVPRATDASDERPSAPIAELELAALRALKFADGSGIPTLAETLELLEGRATAYVEIKAPAATEAAVREIVASRADAAVHAFDHRVALAVRALAPGIPTGVLLDSYLVDPASALRAAGARDWWQRWDMIDARLVTRVHDAGGRVVAWTVNDADAAAQLAAMGVDALCSDVLPGLGALAPRRSAT
jgi:glycerophosphoryl diester phosphodiesterase